MTVRVNRRNLTRSIAFALLLRETYGPFERVGTPFYVAIPGFCRDCGMPLHVGDQACQGRRLQGEPFPLVANVHVHCPTPGERAMVLHDIDGDLVINELEDARHGICPTCGRNVKGTRSVEVWLPSGLTANKHWECVQHSGEVHG